MKNRLLFFIGITGVLMSIFPAAPVFSQDSSASEESHESIQETFEDTAIGNFINEEKNIGEDINDVGVEKEWNIFIKIGIALVILILQILLVWGTAHLAEMAKTKIQICGDKKIKQIQFKSIVLMHKSQMIQALCFIINVIKIIFIVLQLIITVPIIFSFFELTKNLAGTLFGYILSPLKTFGLSFLAYIPNLFTIAIILVISRYVLKALKFFTTQIEKGKLVIRGFYAEWAQPTFNILRVLIIAFTIAMIYPNLPNSDSDIFKGVSVLVGILFSLGSSSVIGNLVSGIVMTYMRPFQVGDRITINGITGFVLERGPMVTRIRTHKNEIISFPNQMVMNNSVTNYSSATTMGFAGLVVHIEITMGYDVPYQKVYEILLNAASKSEHLEKMPVPFINQLQLDDFYCRYEINAYTKDINVLPAVYSELYENIQNGFSEQHISMYAPHYQYQIKAQPEE
ncbi:MAG: mechanosensitive ion channel family protein [Spirochaetaceae bacterium]|jgi:small-conductance mechanosensitive channel|nr:mechanosensitive ion channel family protein [Spirochaetaceae bacterium]